jgi:hypothetical protein
MLTASADDPAAFVDAACAALGCTEADILRELSYRIRRARSRAARTAARLASRRHTAAPKRQGRGTQQLLAQHEARIPVEAYHFWSTKLGNECWQDPAFKREFLRDNPQCAVRTDWDKTTLHFSPPAPTAPAKK